MLCFGLLEVICSGVYAHVACLGRTLLAGTKEPGKNMTTGTHSHSNSDAMAKPRADSTDKPPWEAMQEYGQEEW